jgi:hypothetical protein
MLPRRILVRALPLFPQLQLYDRKPLQVSVLESEQDFCGRHCAGPLRLLPLQQSLQCTTRRSGVCKP